jgi:EAL domain-containing protein (putative c-di-GMP-specific phosphodiesterase class I)
MISPAEFIPIAEDTGLINQLGEWVLSTACAEAATGRTRPARVNVSPVQFKSRHAGAEGDRALAASGLPASRLELEITEAVLIRDDDARSPCCTSSRASACASRSTISAPAIPR